MSGQKTDKIGVLIVDDQRLIRDGIASILALFDDIQVLETAKDGTEAMELARKLKPDVILMDIRMPETDGIQAAASLRSEGNQAAIIMLTTFDDQEYIVKAMKAGAAGYLLKDLPPEDLHSAIISTSKGGFHSTSAVMQKLSALLAPSPAPRQMSAAEQACYQQLSPKERDIVALIGEGATNAEIASELGLTEGTVRNYVSSILDVMGFRDRIRIALFAAENGLTEA